VATYKQWIVSSYVRVSWSQGRIVISSAASDERLITQDFGVIRLVNAFSQARTIAEVLEEFAGPWSETLSKHIEKLIDAGILVSTEAPEQAALHRWDPDALAYHRASRREGFRPVGVILGPALSKSISNDAIHMLREGPQNIGRLKASEDPLRKDELEALLEIRQSRRQWGAEALSFKTLSKLLWLSAGDRDGSRSYPSGGAIYSLDLYLVIGSDAVQDVQGGLYIYLPSHHVLDPISTDRTKWYPFLEAAGRSASTKTPPIVILITSRIREVNAYYGELAYSLVLKEIGCIFQTLYLVCESLGLAGCALGGGAPDNVLSHLCSTHALAEPLLGEFLLGTRG
jgi:SagB-type dehydrogenase family enzyme